ncbi:MAG: alanine--tRNA ligase-related protein [Candidatus Moranbacteria bacterium]|nr:alanine--tRNA ligase-related protein [Candidatus Moranbacteria bacterium]
MRTDEIRKMFLEFFIGNRHVEIGNVSLIPKNDPTLLIINSGMAPLKSFFTGESDPPSRRLCNVQRCVRTNDIESVGDPHHLTFFEMMGNWSIGDYFKREAIELAWKLVRDVFGFDVSRVSVTVFGGDDHMPSVPADSESRGIWSDFLPRERIIPLGADSNFWGPTSDTGPCGPCTEVFFDRGTEKGCGKDDCGPECGCGRFLEIWNAGVFMQYYMHEDRSLSDLPLRSVDAGAGIERFSLVLQGADSIYETDMFLPLLEVITSKLKSVDNMRSIRIMADHARATVFMVADGIYPGKTKRDYVLRRVMRRTLLHANLLGLNPDVFLEMAGVVIELFSHHYPSLTNNMELIQKIIISETASFGKVLSKGLKEFDKLTLKNDSKQVSGEDAFRLHDTLGFPLELTKEIADSRGMCVDVMGYTALLEEQRNRSRA